MSTFISPSAPSFDHLKCNTRGLSVWKSFLHSIGLRVLLVLFREPARDRHGSEQKKILISTSRRIAMSRLSVHALPIAITVLVIALNTIGILYGPTIPSIAKYFLQLTAKAHELVISASLTLIVLDIIRHQMISDRVHLGLLSSAFSLPSLSFLWSADLYSVIFAKSRRNQLILFSTVVCSCFLVSTVGPSSASLLLPSEDWVSYGGTEFYIAGTSEQLWPQRLTFNDSGPPTCRQFPLLGAEFCPYAAIKSMLYHIHDPPSYPQWDFYQGRRGTARIITGNSPDWTRVALKHGKIDREMWAWTGHAATVLHLQDLFAKHNIAQSHVKGNRGNLKNFSTGRIIIQAGPVPVVRTACGPFQTIQANITTFAFPDLDSSKQWHQAPVASPPRWGPLKDVQVQGMEFETLSDGFRGRAKWLALPPEFKGSTAGLLHICENTTAKYGRGCAVDARWAAGSTFSVPRAWNAAIGANFKPSMNASSEPPRKEHFIDNTPFYGSTIKADQEWLDEMSPQNRITSDTIYNETTFESILRTSLSDKTQNPSAVLADENFARVLLEYVTTLYFLDAISRTGLFRQFGGGNDDSNILPSLQAGYTPSNKFINNKPIYTRPDPAVLPTTTSHVNVWRYGTTWTLNGPGSYLSVGILSIYLVFALVHIGVVLLRGCSIEAWDSINELLALAWNSSVPAKPGPGGTGALKNCGAGIACADTLCTQVKVVVADDGERLELVAVDERKARRIQGDRRRVVRTEVAYG